VLCVKLVVQVKLRPVSAYEADALAATLRACNRAANWVSAVAYAKDLKRRNELQEETYYDVKATYDLGAQPAVRVIKKVVDAYAALAGNIKNGQLTGKAKRKAQSKPIVFREEAAQPYDDRILSWNLDRQTVSVWTLAGRLKGVPFACSTEQLKLLAYRKGESDLVLRDGEFFLLATVEVPEPAGYEPTGWLGVDMGIVNAEGHGQEGTAVPPALMGFRPARRLRRVQGTPGGGARGLRRPAQHLPPVLAVPTHPPHQPGVPGMVRLPVLRDHAARGPQRLPQHPPPRGCCVAAGQSRLPQRRQIGAQDAGDPPKPPADQTRNQRPGNRANKLGPSRAEKLT
jgi:hypothetical protein